MRQNTVQLKENKNISKYYCFGIFFCQNVPIVSFHNYSEYFTCITVTNACTNMIICLYVYLHVFIVGRRRLTTQTWLFLSKI